MNQKIAEYGYDAITTDGIHLTLLGHKILAGIIQDSFQLRQ